MRRLFVIALVAGAIVAVLRARLLTSRPGVGITNDVVNPFLLRRGLAGSGGSHLATLEHVGRRSGTRRLTPLHPIVEGDHVRFAVPLGERSEWARNVLAAGHCRLQLEDRILELDEPRLLAPRDVPGIGRLFGVLTDWLGWRYLVVRRFDEHPGELEPEAAADGVTGPTSPVPTPSMPVEGESTAAAPMSPATA
jgi:hypothetical protein